MIANQLFNENCLDTMAKMPSDFIDLTVTSPPYDNLRAYKGYSFDFESIAKQLFRVTKNGGVVVWIVNDATVKGSETGTSFRQALYFKEIGFNLHDTMIWQKSNPMPKVKTKRYFDVFEYMFILSKGQPKTFNPLTQETKLGGKVYNSTVKQITTDKKRIPKKFVLNKQRYINNIWVHAISQNKTDHPAVFPQSIVDNHIKSWSNPDDLIYDPFIGSGTTALSCVELNRKFIGSEISKEYCEMANKRINDAQGSSK